MTSVGLEDAAFALSKFGDLIFVSGGLGAASFDTSLVWVDREGRETAIDAESAHYIAPQVSPDGRRIASIRMEGTLGVGEIWILNADGTQAFPLAAEGADYNPVWAPDGESVTYTSDGNIFEKRVDQDDARLQLMSRSNYQLPRSW